MSYSQNVVVIEGRQQFSIAANEETDALDAGVYDVWSGTGGAYIKVGPTADDVTDETGYLVPEGAIITVRIGRDGLRIGATAELHIHRVE